MESLLRDLKFGTKLLWKDKGFTITAVLTLGLCIGANTTVFTVVDSVLLSPLPYPHGDRLVLMFNSYPNAGVERASTGVPDYYDRLREVDVFEEQALFNFRSRTIGEEGTPERHRGMEVTPSLFRVLESAPQLGRTFTEEEGEPGNAERVVLSHALWQQLYGGDPEVPDRELRIDGVVHTVVGVMPEEFLFLDDSVRLWTPLAFTPEQKSDQARHSNSWTMVGRLKPGATAAQAQAQIDALNAANLERFPMFKELLINAGFHSLAVPLRDDLVREIAPRLYLLWGAVFFVLLIGCVNIANLVLVRSSGRIKELATRAALGAGRGRVIRQLLTESVLLTIIGGALGLLIGHLGLAALSHLAIDQIPRGAEIAIEGHVVLATLGLAGLIGLVFGLIPVVSVARINMSAVLHQEGRTGSSGRGARTLRKVLVGAQVMLAFVLLIGAGLLLASFREILAVDPGFEPQQVLTASVNLPAARYGDDGEQRSFTARAIAAIRSLPEVAAVGATSNIPFGGNYSDSVILAEGYAMAPGESLISPSRLIVTPGYFESLGIPLRSGRTFDQRDTAESPQVVIVDERLAQRFWPGLDPLGRRMFLPNNPEDLLTPAPDTDYITVVGVVGEIKLKGLLQSDSVGAYYFPEAQRARRFLTFTIKTGGVIVSVRGVIASVRREIASLDPELALFNARTMEERMSESLLTRRTPLLLVMIFGALALCLSAVGLYGVMAYSVTQRTRELGIRMALGSSGRRVFRLVLNEGLLILGIGAALGLFSAVLLRNALASHLYGVEPLEPGVLVLVSVVLGLTSLAACLIPALRATRINPVQALGYE